METIKIPGPMRMIWGSLGAWWLAYMINPGFNPVAVMLIFMIPVVVIEINFTATSEKSNSSTPELLNNKDSAQENSTS